MCKKIVLLVLIGGALAYTAKHSRVGKHVVTVFDNTIHDVEESFGADVELGTLKREIRKLESEQMKVQSKYAAAKVDAERLTAQVAKLRKEIDLNERAIFERAEDLKKVSTSDKVKWNGLSISMSEAKDRLQIMVDQFKARKSQLQADEQRLGYLEKDRDTLGQQLSSFKAEIARMHGDVARMQSELNLLKAEKLRQRHYQTTDLSEVKAAFDQLARKIAIEREKLNLATSEIRSNTSDKSVEEILNGLKDETTEVTPE